MLLFAAFLVTLQLFYPSMEALFDLLLTLNDGFLLLLFMLVLVR
jgi:hypothetical protein